VAAKDASEIPDDDPRVMELMRMLDKYGYLFSPPCEGFKVSKWRYCFGKYTSPSGAKYIGEFNNVEIDVEDHLGTRGENGERNYPSYIFPNGEDLDEFISQKRLGFVRGRVTAAGNGLYTFTNGEKYIGAFKDNNFNGKGTFILNDGTNYSGEWKNSKLNGKGIIYKADGSIKEYGVYKDSILITNQYLGQVKEFPLSWSSRLESGIKLYASDNSLLEVSRKYVSDVEDILFDMVKTANETERKFAGAALNQGKTGPVGFGAIKLGMHILDIYALPKSEAIRIPENGWKTTAIPHNNAHCLNKSALDQLTCGGPLPTEISFSDWKSRPEKFPERIDFKVNISNPFVERELHGFLGAKNGILTTIRLDLSSFSSYEQEIIMLRDNVLKLLNEKFGYTKPVVEKREVICGQTRFAQITTSHDWKDNNKLLGTVISNLKTEEVINCYNWMQPYREVKVVLTIVLPSKNAAPSIKNVF
jgi:hypothetical protein